MSSAQVQDVQLVAGSRNVWRLWTTGAYVRQLSPFYNLSTLHLQLSRRDNIVKVQTGPKGWFSTANLLCLSSLVGLCELQVLHESQPILLTGLQDLVGVTSLQLTNVLPAELPCATSAMSIGGVRTIYGELARVFCDMPKHWAAKLQTLSMVMHRFQNDPAYLQGMNCARSLSLLHLHFVNPHDIHFGSRWCAGHFHWLQHIHIDLGECQCTFRPDWDFGTCKSFKTFTLCVDGVLAHTHL